MIEKQCSYTHRVKLALKLKGVEYEYIEEDLSNKSSSLLLYNPIHKKVPVLVHNENPVAESVIILQYVDEAWTGGHQILPEASTHPYERAVIRFWSHFVDDKLGPSVGAVFQSVGEEQKAAVEQVHNYLKLLEDELENGFFKGRRFFGGEKIGLLDIVLGCGSYWLWVFEEVAGVKLVDSGTFPKFESWLRDFEEQEEVKETIPATDKLLEYAKGLRQMILMTVALSVKLFGSWASSYTHRVKLALKLKGVEYEYVEEDLSNKSSSLLLYSPIHKKVPVLVHNENQVAESVIILQYVDETWTCGHQILPESSTHSYERSLIRFWCHFVDDKLGPSVGAVFQSIGEEQKAAVEQVHNYLKLLEDELQNGFFKGRRFLGGEKIGLLDIVLGCGSYWLWVFEEVAGVKLVDSGTFPRFESWLRDFEDQMEAKETIPPTDKLLEYAKGLRQMILSQVKA
ncbi:Glutathione S-transferase [Macleaya cordata]|uniref:glutathione transferase n=1 Tax=Macleaya cordata TaxID=56857 RepID=A0A200QEI9_MACCD|nr:Glutathione S-transferase [Macleaya cordata]